VYCDGEIQFYLQIIKQISLLGIILTGSIKRFSMENSQPKKEQTYASCFEDLPIEMKAMIMGKTVTSNVNACRAMHISYSVRRAVLTAIASPYIYGVPMSSFVSNLCKFYTETCNVRSTISLVDRDIRALRCEPHMVLQLIIFAIKSKECDCYELCKNTCYGHGRIISPTMDNNIIIRCAVSCGRIKLVKLFLGNEKLDSRAYNNLFYGATRKGHVMIVKLLLADPRVDPSEHANGPIRTASQNGHAEVVKLLLTDKRVDPSVKDNWAIRCASRNGHAKIVDFLLVDKRVNPSTRNNEAIRFASEHGHVGVVGILLADSRVDPSAGDNYRPFDLRGYV